MTADNFTFPLLTVCPLNLDQAKQRHVTEEDVFRSSPTFDASHLLLEASVK